MSAAESMPSDAFRASFKSPGTESELTKQIIAKLNLQVSITGVLVACIGCRSRQMD